MASAFTPANPINLPAHSAFRLLTVWAVHASQIYPVLDRPDIFIAFEFTSTHHFGVASFLNTRSARFPRGSISSITTNIFLYHRCASRKHLTAWSEAWREHFKEEDVAALRLQCFWRLMWAKMEFRSLRAQDQVIGRFV